MSNPVYDAAVAAANAHFSSAADRATFLRQMKQESGFKRGQRSSAGAQGPAQLMPGTAAAWGVHDPNNATEAYNAAAKHMAAYLHQYGGSWKDALTAYNAGPGRVGGPLPAETQHYIATILNGKGDAKSSGGPAAPASLGGGAHVTAGKPVTVTPGSTSVDFDGALTDSLLAGGAGHRGSLLKAAQARIAGGGYTTTTAPKINDGTAPVFHPGADSAVNGTGGNDVTAFAESRVGHYKESAGSNRGPELDKLEQRFGMTGQAWCAMFATTAATHGGASRAIRTASVAQINAWASAGSNGYEKGLRSDRDAQAGDLITFGNSHVGYVVGRTDKGVETIEGNNSNGQVNKRFHPYGSGRIARPKR